MMNLSSTNLTLDQILSFMQAEKDYLADNSRWRGAHLKHKEIYTRFSILPVFNPIPRGGGLEAKTSSGTLSAYLLN